MRAEIVRWTCDGCGVVVDSGEPAASGVDLLPPSGWAHQHDAGIVAAGDYCAPCVESVASIFKRRRRVGSPGQYANASSEDAVRP